MHSLGLAQSNSPFKEVIDHNKNGMLFESLNAKDLAHMINTLFEDNVSVHEFSKSAIETINTTFSWDEIAANYKQLLS